MTRVVWISGRAATGKSTLLAACLARLRHAGHHPLRLCDEELLFQLKHADTTHAHHYHPYGDRRFLFRDGYLFDEGLRRISTRVLTAIQTGSPAIVLVELARGSAAPPVDLTWRHALDLIDPRIWPHSLVFRLDAPVQVQLDRNRQRTSDGQPHTPEQILHSLYAQDDPDSLIRAGIAVQPIPHTLPPGQAASLVISTLDSTATSMRPCRDHRDRHAARAPSRPPSSLLVCCPKSPAQRDYPHEASALPASDTVAGYSPTDFPTRLTNAPSWEVDACITAHTANARRASAPAARSPSSWPTAMDSLPSTSSTTAASARCSSPSPSRAPP